MALNLDNIDVNSFGDDTQPVKSVMSEAIKTNPDQYAKTSRLAKESGMPASAVETDPVEVESKLKLNQIDFEGMSQRNPKTSAYMVDFNNAAIAHDDIDVLKSIEDVFNPGKTFENIGESIKVGFEGSYKGVKASIYDSLLNKAAEALVPADQFAEYSASRAGEPGYLPSAIRPLSSVLAAAALGIDSNEELQQARTASVEQMITDLKDVQSRRQALTPEGLTTLEQGVRSGIESLAITSPGLLATIATRDPKPMLAIMGAQTYGTSYGEGRAGGLTETQADSYAKINASIEVLTEAVPASILSDFFKTPGLKNKLAKFVLGDIAGEQVATLGQTATAVGYELDEQLANATSVEEMLAIQAQRQVVTLIATATAVGTQSAILAPVKYAADKLTAQQPIIEQESQIDQARIDSLASNAESSRLRQRDAESFRQFAQQADGDNNSQVYIDGPQVSLYLQSLKPEQIANDPALQLLQANVAEAAALGSDVAIPVADFATDIVGTPHYEQLREHMTMSQSLESPFRQEQAKVETENYVKRILDDAQENVSEYVAAQDIYNNVRDQLVDTGMVSGANASISAQLVPAWAVSYAKRQGISVEEAFTRSGLNITGPQTGEAQRLSDAALEQSVFHGTPHQFDQFTLDAIGTGEGAQAYGYGLYFTNDKEVANQYKKSTSYINVVRDFKKELPDDADFSELSGLISDGHFDERQTAVLKALENDDWLGFDYPSQAIDAAFKQIDRYDPSPELKTAIENYQNLYQANVPEDAELLDWNLKISEQPNVISKFDIPEGSPVLDWTGEQFYRRLAKNAKSDKAASEYLNRKGLPGLKFKPEGRENTNYVIWDDGKVAIESVNERPLEQNNGEARGYYDPANSMIRLTESADLSTFLHEFAHFMYEMEMNVDSDLIQSVNNWFKRNAESVVVEANAYANNEPDFINAPVTVTVEDVTTFLDNKTTGNAQKDAAIRRATHEQFARGFETYLMEGEAPSVELRNAFRTFARWLTQIYKAIRGDLKVKLDDQMRQVFDRLIATDDQIAAAESRARYEPLFTDAAMAGMTEAEFEAYKKRQEKVKDKETETLRDKIMAQLTRQTKAWWKEEKNDLIREEITKLNERRVYRARNRLAYGDIKLDHATVKAMVGVTGQDARGHTFTKIPPELKGMTAKAQAGIHPDEAAAFLGYQSGSEMLDDLISAPKIKDAAEINAEREMVARHGDTLNDGTIEREADEAVQNEERGKLILDELKVLSKGTQQPFFDRQTIKTLAENRIGQLSFREIHPGKYRKAEIAAAQEAASMLAKGNREGAANAKARQVLNYYLGMAATNARNETQKIVDRMARYNKKNVREEIQKAEGGYWEQIVNILERFEFRKSATLGQVAQRNQDINTWAANRIEVEGDGLVLTPAVLNESYVTHWKNVPFADLQGINDSVKNIEHVARYSNKITRMGDEVDFQQLVDRWVTSMNEKATDRFISTRTTVVEGKNWGRWAMAQMTKIPYLASWMDGGERVGISHQILVQPFTDAYNQEIKMWNAAGKPVMDAIEGRSKADIKRHNTKIFIPEINDNLFVHQILAVALNTGNQGNLKKMLLGEGWADPEVETDISFNNPKLQAVLSKMTQSDWELVQLIWNQMDTLYPQLSEVHRRTTGLVPPKVEATPVVTPFGTFNGGYYPVKYDPNRSQQAQENEDRLNAQTESMFSNNASIQASVNAGATNERTGYYAPIRLSLDVVSAHFQETIHYITHHDPVREVNKLIRNKSVADTIKAKLGPEEFAQLKPWLNDIAKDGKEAPVKMFWDALLQKLRLGVTLGTMGFKASTGLMQLSGLSNTIAEVGIAPVLQSTRSVFSSFVIDGSGITGINNEAWEFAKANSKVLEFRAQSMDREIKNAMKDLESKRGWLPVAQQASMKHIALIQTYMADLPSWHAGYIKGMKDFDGDEQRAFQYADWIVEQVQGSGTTQNMARIMRGQSETARMLTMFMTFFSSLWNMERDTVKGAKSGNYSVSTLAAKGMFLIVVPVLFEMLLRGQLGGEDDDDENAVLQRMLTKVAVFPFQSVPFLRDIVNGATGDFGYNISPLASVIEQGTAAIPKLAEAAITDEEATERQIKGATKLTGAAFGIPGVSQAWATGEHMYDVMVEGEEFTMRELLMGPDRK